MNFRLPILLQAASLGVGVQPPVVPSASAPGHSRACKAQPTALPAEHLPSFLLQVIGVKGANPTGHTLVAQSVYTSFPPPAPAAPAPLAAPMCVVVAAGPYSTAENLCFAPLDHILQHCQGERRATAACDTPMPSPQGWRIPARGS